MLYGRVPSIYYMCVWWIEDLLQARRKEKNKQKGFKWAEFLYLRLVQNIHTNGVRYIILEYVKYMLVENACLFVWKLIPKIMPRIIEELRWFNISIEHDELIVLFKHNVIKNIEIITIEFQFTFYSKYKNCLHFCDWRGFYIRCWSLFLAVTTDSVQYEHREILNKVFNFSQIPFFIILSSKILFNPTK